jgi:hypothetical protein
LQDGRALEGARDTFLGCPETPMTSPQLAMKFDSLTTSGSDQLKRTLFDDLMRLEHLPSLDGLALA